jgi:hypothetical protein
MLLSHGVCIGWELGPDTATQNANIRPPVNARYMAGVTITSNSSRIVHPNRCGALGATTTISLRRSKVMKTFLSIPTSKKDVYSFRNHIWYRYTGKEYPCDKDVNIQNLDRASAYMERVIDRIINKARGTLPFNSILLVIVGIERAENTNPLIVTVTLASLAFSSLILLTLF